MKWWPLVWRSSYDELAKELAWQVHELNRKIEVIRADNEQLYKDTCEDTSCGVVVSPHELTDLEAVDGGKVAAIHLWNTRATLVSREDAAAKFMNWLWEMFCEGAGVDMFDIQEKWTDLGLIEARDATREDIENHGFNGEEGDVIFDKSSLFPKSHPAANAVSAQEGE